MSAISGRLAKLEKTLNVGSVGLKAPVIFINPRNPENKDKEITYAHIEQNEWVRAAGETEDKFLERIKKDAEKRGIKGAFYCYPEKDQAR